MRAARWARTETVWNTGYLPDAPVLTHDGRTVPFYEGLVKDRLVVISFIYTKCRDICPVVTARLAQVQEKLGPAFGRDVQFLSISIDPENDKVENLKAYAETFGAGPGWTFITGDAPTMALIRHKLGERSRVLSEHGNTVLLYNDRTGEWSRDSAFSDLNVLAANIRAMNPTALSSGRRMLVQPRTLRPERITEPACRARAYSSRPARPATRSAAATGSGLISRALPSGAAGSGSPPISSARSACGARAIRSPRRWPSAIRRCACRRSRSRPKTPPT